MSTNKPHDRLDASESVFFNREMEAIDSRFYNTVFQMLKGRSFLPRIADVGEYDRTYTYRQFTTSGKAAVISNPADDLPRVNATGNEFTSRIKPLGISYGYDLFEIRAAAAGGKPLDQLLIDGARQGMEETIDDLLAFGSTLHGFEGFANHSAIDESTYSPVNGTWVASSRTGAQMVADVNKLVSQVWNALKEAAALAGPLNIVLPAPEYAYLVNTPMGDNADKSAYDYLVKSPFIAGIEPWHKLTGAGDSATNRMIAYRKDPLVLGALIPQEFTPQPFQQRGLLFSRDVTASCGGAVVRYPVACAYGDGI